jgi:hypothetical protein
LTITGFKLSLTSPKQSEDKVLTEIIVAVIGGGAALGAAYITAHKRKDREEAVAPPPKFDWESNKRTHEQDASPEDDLLALHSEIEFRKRPGTEVRFLGNNQ